MVADMDDESQSFEDALIADMRANHGVVTTGPLAGHPLLVLTSTGARTGQRRRAILTRSRDGDAYVIAGTDDGAPRPPAWLANVRANPAVEVETDDQRFPARAEVLLEGPERDRLWAQHVAALPHFAPYPAIAGRIIPIVRLHRID
jgi:deazaflavin-dependent oxidoreductase (nitroreductase family)